jgi:hypothetical protein
MGEICIFCPIPSMGNKSKYRRLGKQYQNGILEVEKVSNGSKAGGVEKISKHECNVA